MRISALWRYPVKSTRGRSEDELVVDPWGAVGDRRWAVVDPDGTNLTAREVPALLRIRAEPLDEGVGLAVGEERLVVPTPYDGTRVPVDLSRQPDVLDAGDGPAAFLDRHLGRPARLVWQPDPTLRSVAPEHGGSAGEVLSLADAGPLLLISEASLGLLRDQVGDRGLDLRRFRPNVVIDGEAPYAEDGWDHVRLGDVDLRVQGPCDRCVMTTIDPDTLDRGPEPIRTLAAHRKRDGKVWFGVWLVPITSGTLRVGDPATASS